jgi:hypothetical protein
VIPVEPVVLPPCFLLHGTHGCNRHPAFPAPSSIFEGQIICITRARTRRGVAEMCSIQGGVTRATRVEGEVGQPSLIRSARQLSQAGSDCPEAWPLSQPWLSAADRGVQRATIITPRAQSRWAVSDVARRHLCVLHMHLPSAGKPAPSLAKLKFPGRPEMLEHL